MSKIMSVHYPIMQISNTWWIVIIELIYENNNTEQLFIEVEY